VERLTERALKTIESAGGVLIESRLPDLPALIQATTAIVQNHDLGGALAAYLAEHAPTLGLDAVLAAASPDVQRILRRDALPGGANFPSKASYAAARDRHLPALRRLFREYFAHTNVAALVFPTTLTPAPRIGADREVGIGGRTLPFETAIARNIAPGSTAGLPGLVLPIGLSAQGLPVALEFDAPTGADRPLLALGTALEALFEPLPVPP
jgi:mandelamide amidase